MFFFWNSLAFLMMQQMLAIWSLVPLSFLKPAWTPGISQFTYCWSLVELPAPRPPANKFCHCFHCFPIYLPWSDGTGGHELSFLIVDFYVYLFPKRMLALPVHSLERTVLAFALLHSVPQGQICLLIQVFLDFLLLHSSLAGLHRTVQLQLLQQYTSGHSLGLQWYWMVCLRNEQKSFCSFWDCIQVLQFRLSCWLLWLLHFF